MSGWLRAELQFASFYSYRMPQLSPQYALASPLPSPASLRLALVDAAIQQTGSVDYGRQVFEWVKTAPLFILPPQQVSVLKFFIRRLKKPKATGASFVQSTGVREYCHLNGPLEAYLKVPQSQEVASAFSWLRRLGTSDSLLSATVRETGEPPLELCWKKLADQDLPINGVNYERRLVVALTELRPEVDFDDVNPYSEGRQRRPFTQDSYLLPLVLDRRGENWVLYRRKPFELWV